MNKNILAIVRRMLRTLMALTVAVAAALSVPAASAQRDRPPQRASHDVFWIWDASAVTGTWTQPRTGLERGGAEGADLQLPRWLPDVPRKPVRHRTGTSGRADGAARVLDHPG